MFEEAPNLKETGGQLFYYAGILFAGFLIFIGRRGGWVVEKSERIFFFFLYRDNLWLRGLLDTASRKCLRMFIGN